MPPLPPNSMLCGWLKRQNSTRFFQHWSWGEGGGRRTWKWLKRRKVSLFLLLIVGLIWLWKHEEKTFLDILTLNNISRVKRGSNILFSAAQATTLTTKVTNVWGRKVDGGGGGGDARVLAGLNTGLLNRRILSVCRALKDVKYSHFKVDLVFRRGQVSP